MGPTTTDLLHPPQFTDVTVPGVYTLSYSNPSHSDVLVMHTMTGTVGTGGWCKLQNDPLQTGDITRPIAGVAAALILPAAASVESSTSGGTMPTSNQTASYEFICKKVHEKFTVTLTIDASSTAVHNVVIRCMD